MADWQPLWCDPTRTNESKAILDYDVQNTLGPITLLELDGVLLTYPSKVGLGADCLHPRSISLLSDDFRLRVIDMMHSWESRPEVPLAWITLSVFRPKPDGGYRPIGLTASILRVWSRLRSRKARAWEQANMHSFFWGGAGKACDAAG